jgi:voltage-gated potassium channel
MKFSELRKFFISAGLLLFSLFVGVTGFIVVEGYNLLDSFYMTALTISTVGFDEVKPLSDSGKLFATVYIILNLGIFAYVVSTITTYIFEGELQKIFKYLIFGRELKKLKNHVIVCGYGRHGSRSCKELVKSQTPFVIIDKETGQLEFQADEKFPVVNGDATTDDALIEAGILKARALITTLPHDADNVFITLTAKELNPAVKVISRASDKNSEKKLYRAGANRVVLPDILGGIHMAHLITKPYVVEFLEILNGMGDGHLKLEDYTFDQLKDKYQNKTLGELNIATNTGATVVGLKSLKQGFTFRPNHDTVVTESDVLILLGSIESLNRFESYCK